jgi:hypothetical protein
MASPIMNITQAQMINHFPLTRAKEEKEDKRSKLQLAIKDASVAMSEKAKA